MIRHAQLCNDAGGNHCQRLLWWCILSAFGYCFNFCIYAMLQTQATFSWPMLYIWFSPSVKEWIFNLNFMQMQIVLIFACSSPTFANTYTPLDIICIVVSCLARKHRDEIACSVPAVSSWDCCCLQLSIMTYFISNQVNQYSNNGLDFYFDTMWFKSVPYYWLMELEISHGQPPDGS